MAAYSCIIQPAGLSALAGAKVQAFGPGGWPRPAWQAAGGLASGEQPEGLAQEIGLGDLAQKAGLREAAQEDGSVDRL